MHWSNRGTWDLSQLCVNEERPTSTLESNLDLRYFSRFSLTLPSSWYLHKVTQTTPVSVKRTYRLNTRPVFYKPDAPENIELPGLADADAVLKRTLGSAAQYLWGAGLLAGKISFSRNEKMFIFLY